MQLLEGVQKRATKLVPELRNKGYTKRLKILKQLSCVYYTRACGDMIEVFKHLQGAYSVSQCPLILDDNPAVTLGHSLKLKKFWCARSTTSNFFIE